WGDAALVERQARRYRSVRRPRAAGDAGRLALWLERCVRRGLRAHRGRSEGRRVVARPDRLGTRAARRLRRWHLLRGGFARRERGRRRGSRTRPRPRRVERGRTRVEVLRRLLAARLPLALRRRHLGRRTPRPGDVWRG